MPPRQVPERLFDLGFGSVSIVDSEGACSQFLLTVNGKEFIWGDPEDYHIDKIYQVAEELEECARIVKGV